MWLYLLKSKDQAAQALERFLADTRLDVEVQAIRTDNGSEFAGRFDTICDRHRIKRERTVPDRPELNR